jgi:prevent-host-death family protein
MFASISAMQLRTSIGAVLNRIEYKGDRVVIERKGTPVAALVSVEDLHRLEALEAEREIELFRLAKRAAEEEGFVTFDDLVAAVERAHGVKLDLPVHV